MKIHYQDLRNPRRTPLVEGVPLDTPFLVMVEPANVCNLRCRFCPTGHPELRRQVPHGVMEWDLYQRIVDGFRVMPHRIKQLTFCKDGEPLLNKRLVDMLRLAREADIAERVWLKTNGLLLTPMLNSQLAACGLDLIGVSVKAVSAAGYERVTGVAADYEHLREMVADLHSKCTSTNVYVNTVNTLTPLEADKFYADFEGISTTIAIEDLHGWSAGFSTDITQEDTIVTPKVACPWPLLTMAINFDGTASACQEDWSMANIVGDLHSASVGEVWRGARRRAFLRAHLLGRRGELPACANCSYIEFSPDNIDAHRGALLGRL